MTEESLPVGKLPPELLAQILGRFSCSDPQVLVGPGPGLDCAVVNFGGDRLLVLKSDPITFATDELGEYLVRINTNDIATTGAVPRWMLVTLLLPEHRTSASRAEALMGAIHQACQKSEIALVGGHTEITHGLERPIAVGALVGEVEQQRLVTPKGASPGDRLLLTKGVPIEGTAILAHEQADSLHDRLSQEELKRARGFLADPGLDVLRDAQVAMGSGRVTAMHDPTEGGLVEALWELAEASGRTLVVDPEAVPVPELSRRICAILDLNPLATIASGALLLTVNALDAEAVCSALREAGLSAVLIGEVGEALAVVREPDYRGGARWVRPERDEIARLFEG